MEIFKILHCRMKYKSAERWAGIIMRKGHMYLWSCISIIFYRSSSYCFCWGDFTCCSFHATLCISHFKVWTWPFMLTTLWWRLSCHHLPVNAAEHHHPAGPSRANQAIGSLSLCQTALTQARCFILCSCFLVNLCALLPLQYSLTQVTCTVNIYLTLRFI